MKKTKFTLLMAVVLMAVAFTGCRIPYMVPEFVEAKSNETIFVVPLEVDSKDGQSNLKSIDYLEDRKVQAKRIELKQRWVQMGRRRWQGVWKKTEAVLIVDRAPVSREWVASSNKGTSDTDQSFIVESKDSIGFNVGGVASAFVSEEDTSTFLYWYSGITLAEIMDTNVFADVQSGLTEGFAQYNMKEARGEKANIFKKVALDVTAKYKEFGITITTCGISGQLEYINQNIQDKIDEEFESAMAVSIAANKKLEQDEVNGKNVAMATSEANQAKEFAKAIGERQKQIALEIQLMDAETRQILANNWDGAWPKWMMGESGSNFMFTVPTE